MSDEEPRRFDTKFKQPDVQIELVPEADSDGGEGLTIATGQSPVLGEFAATGQAASSENTADIHQSDLVEKASVLKQPVEIEQSVAKACDTAPDLDATLSTLRESLLGFSKSNTDTNRKSHLNADPVAKFGGEALLHFGSVSIFFVTLLIVFIAVVSPHQVLTASRIFNILIVVIPVFTLFAHSYTTQFAGYTALKGKHALAEFFYNLSNGVFRHHLYITIREFSDTADGAAADYYMRTGRLRKANAHIDYLLKVTTPNKDLKALAKVTLLSTMKASVVAELGRTPDADVWIEESLNWFERSSSMDESDRQLIASECLHNIAAALRLSGSPKLALSCYLQSLAEATGTPRSTTVLMRTILGVGQVCLDLNDLDGAANCFQLLEDVIATYRNLDNETILQLRIASSRLKLLQGAYTEAAEILAGEQERLVHQGKGLRNGQLYTARAEVSMRTGDLADAIENLERALEIYRRYVPVSSPYFKEHLALYDQCLKQLAETQPDLSHEKRAKCVELLLAQEQLHAQEQPASPTSQEEQRAAAVSSSRKSVHSLRKSGGVANVQLSLQQKIVFGIFILIGVSSPILGGIRAADFFEWTLFLIGTFVALITAHNYWGPKFRQYSIGKKLKDCEAVTADVTFKRIDQSEWTNAQVFKAIIGAPFKEELVVADHMAILTNKLFEYAKPNSYSILCRSGAPVAVATADGAIPLMKAGTEPQSVITSFNRRSRLRTYGFTASMLGALVGIFYLGTYQMSMDGYHSKIPPNLTAYEYYRYGAKILTDSGDLAHPDRLAVGEKSLLKAQELDGNGAVGKAAMAFAQTHVLKHVPSEEILRDYKNAQTKIEKNDEDAVSALQDLIKRDPEFLLPYVSLAEYHVQKHQLEDASKALEKAAAINPKDSRYLIVRARYEAAIGNHDAVKAIAKQLLDSDPLNAREAAQVLFF